MSYFTNGTSQTKTKNYTVQNNSPLFMQKETTVTRRKVEAKVEAAQKEYEKHEKLLKR